MNLRSACFHLSAITLSIAMTMAWEYAPIPKSGRITDIEWKPAGSLHEARYTHTATLLSSGKVLVAGGRFRSSSHMSSCEIFDPAAAGGAGVWSKFEPMLSARSQHTATLLRSGHVMITGGWNNRSLPDCEVHNPWTGGWIALPPMNRPRYEHTATLLSGNRVLVIGSKLLDLGLRACEIFEYQEVRAPGSGFGKIASGYWRFTDSMKIGRGLHTTTVLKDGRILVTGGVSDYRPPASCEIFDPAAETWSSTASMRYPREGHTATLLPDGTVLIAGGDNPERSACELFDPKADGGRGAWRMVKNMNTGRRLHRAMLLPDATVLVTGAWITGHGARTCEILDGEAPESSTWEYISPMISERCYHTITRLNDGRILLAGGEVYGSQSATSACELGEPVYDPVAVHPLPGPSAVSIHAVYPNPFTASVTMVFSSSHADHVEVSVCNSAGLRVRKLCSGISSGDSQTAHWDGLDDAGSALCAGLYFFRFASQGGIRLTPVVFLGR